MESSQPLNSRSEFSSRSSELTTVSYVVLGLVGAQGAGAHDLVQMMRRGGVYYAVSPSQIYAEPKRLERLGYLTVREEPGRTRPRKVYSLTDEGRHAVGEWMSQPAGFPRLQHEAAVRVMCADLAGAPRVLESLCGMRPEIERVLADIAVMEQRAEDLPHRRANLDLINWFGRRWCELLLAWLDEAEQVLSHETKDMTAA
jgi:DNA-binding PadR family transcriptional regulator